MLAGSSGREAKYLPILKGSNWDIGNECRFLCPPPTQPELKLLRHALSSACRSQPNPGGASPRNTTSPLFLPPPYITFHPFIHPSIIRIPRFHSLLYCQSLAFCNAHCVTVDDGQHTPDLVTFQFPTSKTTNFQHFNPQTWDPSLLPRAFDK